MQPKVALAAPHFPTRGCYQTNMVPQWADNSQQHELACSLTKTNRLIKAERHVSWEASEHPFLIYRLMMEDAGGAQFPNRLICCPTSNTTCDRVWFLLTKAFALPAATILDPTTDCAPKSGACVTKYYTLILEKENVSSLWHLGFCQICVRL